MLQTEKKEINKRLVDLKQEKTRYGDEITHTRGRLQKLQEEIDFMNKKILKRSGYERFSPEKSKRTKEMRLASLQVQVSRCF